MAAKPLRRLRYFDEDRRTQSKASVECAVSHSQELYCQQTRHKANHPKRLLRSFETLTFLSLAAAVCTSPAQCVGFVACLPVFAVRAYPSESFS